MTPLEKQLTFKYEYRDSFTSDYGDESGNWSKCQGTVTASLRPRVATDPTFEFDAVPQNFVLELQLYATSGARGDFESGYPADVRGDLAGKQSLMLVSGTSVAQKLSSEWHGMPDMFVTK